MITLEAELEVEFTLTLEQVDLASRTITGLHKDGRHIAFKVTEQTKVEAQGALFSIFGLQPGVIIEVKINPVTGEALKISVETRDEDRKPPKLGKSQGTIKSADRESKTLVLVLLDGSELTLTFGPSTKIGAGGEEATTADIQKGLQVTVVYAIDTRIIDVIELHRPQIKKPEQPEKPRVERLKVEGVIIAIDQAQGTLTIFTRKGEKLVLRVFPETNIALNDKRLKALSEMPSAAAVTVEYSTDGNVAISIRAEVKEAEQKGKDVDASGRTVVAPHVLETKGTLVEVAPAKGVVIIKTEKGEALTLKVTADTTVIINVPAKESRHLGSISDLAPGANVVVQYNESDLALRIVIVQPELPAGRTPTPTRQQELLKAQGTLVEVATARNAIVIRTEKEPRLTLTLTADTRILINLQDVSARSIAALANLPSGASIAVEYTTSNVALRIVINQPGLPPEKTQPTPTRQPGTLQSQATPTKQPETLKAKGIIKGIGAGGGSITIATEGGVALTLTVNASTQIAIEEEGVQRRVASLTGVAAGATVEVEYTSDGVAKVIIVDIKTAAKGQTPVPTAQATLKAKGVIKGVGGGTGGSSSITIVTEGGTALVLTVNASTQFAINDPGVGVQRRVASLSDLIAGATVEVEYTADGVAKSIIQNIRA